MTSSLQYARELPGQGGLPKLVLTHPSGARAEIYRHGAQVTSWTTAHGVEQLFLSEASAFDLTHPIRGGIPVIFPQFGGGTLPQHGFARVSEWQVGHTGLNDAGEVTALLRLTTSVETLACWPYAFMLELEARLGADTLAVRLRVRNTGARAFPMQAALHTYFAVADIAHTTVHGLCGGAFIDSLCEDARGEETREVIAFAEETDRIYPAAPDTLAVADAGHVVTLTKSGMPDVVVWNPWIAKAQRMTDFGDDEYRRMVCVETGLIDPPFALAVGNEWVGETVFTTK